MGTSQAPGPPFGRWARTREGGWLAGRPAGPRLPSNPLALSAWRPAFGAGDGFLAPVAQCQPQHAAAQWASSPLHMVGCSAPPNWCARWQRQQQQRASEWADWARQQPMGFGAACGSLWLTRGRAGCAVWQGLGDKMGGGGGARIQGARSTASNPRTAASSSNCKAILKPVFFRALIGEKQN